jgi:flagellar motor switch protein FliM
MASASARADGAPGDRWFEKPAGSPLERFPVLGEAFTTVAERWTDSFSALSASPGELHFKGLRIATVADLARHDHGLPIFAALKVTAWDCPVALALGRPLVSAVVEAFFGGGDEEEVPGAERPVSPVEMRIVDVIGGQAATALTAGFKDYVPARFDFERTQAKPDVSFLGKPATPVIAATFAIKAVGRSVTFDVVLPLGAIEARQEAWAGAAGAAPKLDEARWSVQLKAEVARASMRLKAKIEMAPTELGDVARWKVGQVVELPSGAGRNVLLTCEEEVLFRCELGQSAGRYTLRIGERAAAPPSRKGD